MQFVENSKKALDALDHKNDMKKNESKAMLVQERRYSDDSIAMIDVDWESIAMQPAKWINFSASPIITNVLCL